jgi:glutathione S-transferase
MPRPILAELGLAYRRIPLTAIGNAVYCDTLAILAALEKTFADSSYPSISATTPEAKAIEYLLEKWTELAVFGQAADLIPLDHPLVQDPVFIKDRTELWAESWDRDHRAKKRTPAVDQMKGFYVFLEKTIFADGRQFVLGTDKPSLADIQSAWIFEWMMGLEGSYPEDSISEKIFPKTYAWCKRYRAAVDEATNAGPKPEEIDGAAAEKILASASASENFPFDSKNPFGLKQGQEVQVSPTDTGLTGVQKGKLVGLDENETVVSTQTKAGTGITVHFPRWKFQVIPATA